MFLQIVKILLPIITALIVGISCRKYNLIDDAGINKIKNLLNEIILPVVLFNSFLFANYSLKSIVFVVSVLLSAILAYFIGCFLKRFVSNEYKDNFPEFVSTWEGGTLGISLCSLLLGIFGMQQMAIFDFGQALFLFGYIVPTLKIKDGLKVNSKQIFKLVFSSKAFDGIVLGVICGIFGFGKLISSYPISNTIYHGIVDMIMSPTNFLIMLMVGYSINIKKDLLKPVLLTCVFRLISMWTACALAYFIIFRFVPYDKKIFLVLLVAYSLPPTYSLPLFTSFKGNTKLQEYCSTVISFSTILALIIFVFISIYAQIN